MARFRFKINNSGNKTKINTRFKLKKKLVQKCFRSEVNLRAKVRVNTF